MRNPEKTTARCALARLRDREPVLGVLQAMAMPLVTEIAIWCGYDFVILDCEHGIVDERAQLGSFQVVTDTDAFAVVRLRPGDLSAVGRYLELGAGGIMLPDVQTAAQAAEFVAAATYGPAGTRSSTSTGTRSTRFGLGAPLCAAPPLVLAMIEGRAGVAAIEEIVAVPGLDGIVVGSHDLSADLGAAGDFTTPQYADAFARITRAAAASGLLLGGGAHGPYSLERLVDCGYRFLLGSVDFLALRDGYRGHRELAMRAIREAQGERIASHQDGRLR